MNSNVAFWNQLLLRSDSISEIKADDPDALEQVLAQLATIGEQYDRTFDPADHFEEYVAVAFCQALQKALRPPISRPKSTGLRRHALPQSSLDINDSYLENAEWTEDSQRKESASLLDSEDRKDGDDWIEDDNWVDTQSELYEDDSFFEEDDSIVSAPRARTLQSPADEQPPSDAQLRSEAVIPKPASPLKRKKNKRSGRKKR